LLGGVVAEKQAPHLLPPCASQFPPAREGFVAEALKAIKEPA